MKKINLEPLREQCGSDTKFFNEMLDIFIRSVNEGLTLMERAIEEQDMKMLGHYAHKLVAPFRHLEIESVVLLLKTLEKNALDESRGRPELILLIRELKVEAANIIVEIEKEYL